MNSPAGAKPRLVLASASPRRVQLLGQIGLAPDIIDPADIAEVRLRGEPPAKMSARLAIEKARVVAARHPDCFVLGGDTVVAVGQRILPKAETAEDARRFLSLLSGRRHKVVTSIALYCPSSDSSGAQSPLKLPVSHKIVTSVVAIKRLEEIEISSYLESGEWLGKAGGYAIQGMAAAYVRHISGSYSAIVGLPLYETRALLNGSGFRC